MMFEEIVTVDVETTGLHPVTERIIELAAVRWVDGEAVEQFQTLVRPDKPIDPRASAVHGLTDDDVADAPLPREALERFHDFAGHLPLAAHNAPFDMGFLAMESLRARVRLAERMVVDTLTLSRKAFPHLPSHKLEFLSQTLGLGAKTHHRALDDARTAGHLLYASIREIGELPRQCRIKYPHGGKNRFTGALRGLKEAIEAGTDTALEYELPNGATSERMVIPIAVVHVMGRSYLHCRTCVKDEDRTYRLDRIRSVRLMEPA